MEKIDIRLFIEAIIWGGEENIPPIIKRQLLCTDTDED